MGTIAIFALCLLHFKSHQKSSRGVIIGWLPASKMEHSKCKCNCYSFHFGLEIPEVSPSVFPGSFCASICAPIQVTLLMKTDRRLVLCSLYLWQSHDGFSFHQLRLVL